LIWSPRKNCNSPIIDISNSFLMYTYTWTLGYHHPALCTNSSDDCTDACIWGTVGSSDGVFSFPFLARLWPFVLAFLHEVFLHPWDVEMYTKTCSNNMVSPNDHVVMNHQNQTPN
jgi:hypothetical protein